MVCLQKHKPHDFLHCVLIEVLCSAGARLLLVVGNQGCEGDTWWEWEREPPGLGAEPPAGSRRRARGRWVKGRTVATAGWYAALVNAARSTSLRHEAKWSLVSSIEENAFIAGTCAEFWWGGSVSPCCLRRGKLWKFDYEIVQSEVYLNKYVISIAPFSTPACPDCSRNINLENCSFGHVFAF